MCAHGYAGEMSITVMRASWSGNRIPSNVELEKKLGEWRKKRRGNNKKLGVLVLISGDSDFLGFLEDFNQARYKTFVIYLPGCQSTELVASGDHSLTMNEFMGCDEE
ncbi:unnamed protein product [Arabis nemorensis]|uniref:NYN domain-containing protein n=1 Tax=Arabis nemorensis TaxID=586526 RepID=A0A565B4T4_9BRAS|nr:unnamed protein product [Arabis nemorensis]